MKNQKKSLLQLLISILICLLLIILTINIFCTNIDGKIAIYLLIASIILTFGSIVYVARSFCSLLKIHPIDNSLNFIVHNKPKAIIISIILLAVFSSSPLIFRILFGYHINYDNAASSFFWVFSIASTLLAIGSKIKPRKYAIPIFIGAVALMPIASLFVISNHSSDISWILIQCLILTTWIMLHIQYCMPISIAARTTMSTIILLIGIPATALMIYGAAFRHAFNSSSGMPASKGLIFFPLVILGPFVLICLIRKLSKSSTLANDK